MRSLTGENHGWKAADRSEHWILGVQWHPEEIAATDASQQALFDTLVRLAGDRTVKA